jgi:hypothetical protein
MYLRINQNLARARERERERVKNAPRFLLLLILLVAFYSYNPNQALAVSNPGHPLSQIDVNASFIPDTDNTYDLGSTVKKWKDLYLAGNLSVGTIISGIWNGTAIGDSFISSANTWNAKQNALGFTPENSANKGAANGYASLDASSKVPFSQLPVAISGALNFISTWNATTNSPTITSSVGTNGDFYIVEVAGTTSLDGISTWNVGDLVIFDGDLKWQRIQNTSLVSSVNGHVGAVVLTKSDIGLSSVANVDTTNASNISSGTLGDSFLSSVITKLGNIFNGANQLVKLDGSGKLPALDGSALTNLPSGGGFDGVFASLTSKPTTLAGYGITDAADGTWAGISGKPTTIAGFGITDAFDGAYASLTDKPTLFDGVFASLTSKPTTIAGYGITDAMSSTLASGKLFIGNGSAVATGVDLSGDATLANTGALTIANLAVTNAKIANSTIDLTAKVTGTLPVANGGTGATTFGGTNTLLYTPAANTLSSIATGNNGVLITSGAGAPSISSTLPTAVQNNITSLGTISAPTFSGIIRRSVTNNITAFATGGQVSAIVMTSDINYITVVTTNNVSSVKLPPAAVGMDITVINDDTGNTVLLFPDSGAVINAGAVNASYAIAKITSARCMAITTTLWECEKGLR